MNEWIWLNILIILAAMTGYHLKFLSASGMVAAIFVGVAIGFGVGANGLILLGIFFATSSVLSKYRRRDKSKAEERHAKGARRDYQQVLANGGPAAVFSIIYVLNQDQGVLLAFATVIACCNSDTWSSEIGTLSKRRPFSLRTFTLSQAGTSGAISLLGTLAGLGGSLVIALSAGYLFHLAMSQIMLIFALGMLGNIIDTLFGAYIQSLYRCLNCGVETEKVIHCHKDTKLISGSRLFNNDTVNLLSSVLPSLFVICFF